MSWLLRPSILVLAWIALTLGALLLVVRPSWQGLPSYEAAPLPVPDGDQEVVWLNIATNVVAWERFVAAVHMLVEHSQFGVTSVDDSNAFPNQTTAVPELAVGVGDSKSRLRFRWYKLTGDLDAERWMQALERRRPAPLAIIGGGSSDRARDLAQELQNRRNRFTSAPVLIVTTATADKVDLTERPGHDLMQIYSDRSFRFCYTDRQMAQAVVDFVWSQPDLRPDMEPIYLVNWGDDPYSKDLFDRFREVLSGEGYGDALRTQLTAQAAARQWAWLGSRLASGGTPPALELEGIRGEDSHARREPFWSASIPYCIGAFSHPNRWESESAEFLVDELTRHPAQRRPLLVLPAMPQPARRFLRALLRTAAPSASRFVVATGDAIDFNTVYRDRRLGWNIQDLPFPLVFFCHRNPVDPVAFVPDEPSGSQTTAGATGTSTGTQDLLLYRDIAATVISSAFHGNRLLPDADALRENLHAATQADGRSRFDPNGNPLGGVGEHIVSLRPVRAGDRVLPRAVMQVWTRTADSEGHKQWVRTPIAGQQELKIDYLQSR